MGEKKGLPGYEGLHCRKCGSSKIATAYDAPHDVLNRRCRTCQFTWGDVPLNHLNTEKEDVQR